MTLPVWQKAPPINMELSIYDLRFIADLMEPVHFDDVITQCCHLQGQLLRIDLLPVGHIHLYQSETP